MSEEEKQGHFEYTIMFNPPYETSHSFVEYGTFADEWAAAERLIDLLNQNYPGKWRPENILSGEPRYTHVKTHAGNYLLAYVDKRPAKIDALRTYRQHSLDNLQYHREAIEKEQRQLQLIDSQIAALTNGSR